MFNNNILKEFPYHPYEYNKIFRENIGYFEIAIDKLNKEIVDRFIASGLLIDKSFNVFVNPNYGAFFFNTNSSTLEEEIKLCNSVARYTVNMNVYPIELELLEYLDNGYEFVLGPSVNLKDNKKYGVYCSNYDKPKKLVKTL